MGDRRPTFIIYSSGKLLKQNSYQQLFTEQLKAENYYKTEKYLEKLRKQGAVSIKTKPLKYIFETNANKANSRVSINSFMMGSLFFILTMITWVSAITSLILIVKDWLCLILSAVIKVNKLEI